MPHLTDLSFAAPGRFWLLVPLAAAVAAGLVLRRRQARSAEPYADDELLPSVAPHRAGWRRPAAATGLVLAVLALTTAFARPQVLAKNAHERAAVVIALDTSSSMLATDVAPDRWTAAKEAAKAFIRDLPTTVDVGLVSFNARVVLVSAPTAQHEQVAAAIDALKVAPGTATGDALQTALRAVTQGLAPGTTDPAARIVLLSDGGITNGTPVETATAAASAAHVPVSTIAYGTPTGTVQSGGRAVPVPVDEAALKQVAEATGGTAYTAATSDQLRSVYDAIGSRLVTDTAREDVADVLSGLALVLLLVTAVPSLAWFARLV